MPYKLTVEGVATEGVTNDQGILEATIPSDATEGSLEFDEHTTQMKFSKLPPIDKLSGVKVRLINLHYYDGPVDDEMDQNTHDALLRFQLDMAQAGKGLQTTGELDDSTRKQLLQEHGS